MRVLLLGSGGFLGRYVAEHLLADPAVQLTALGRGDDADVRFDLSNGSPGALTRFLNAVHPGVVINCAGATRGGARELTRHNTVAVATVCESLRRSGCGARLVQIGCSSEYGPSQPGSSTAEDAVPRPGGPYGVSKLAATELVLGSGLDAVVLRVFSPVGPGTPAGSPLGRLAEAMRRAMQSGESELKLSGLGVQRDFVDVRDVARAVHAASLSAAQGVVNIGSGRAVRLREAASVLARVAGFGGALHEIDSPPGRGGPHHVPAAAVHVPAPAHPHGAAHGHATAHGHAPAHPQVAGEHGGGPAGAGGATTYPYPDGCGGWQQADVRTARDRLGWRSRIPLEESLADIWMEAACRI
ncbi:NAD-dependent epimerase/dehydratase family protein [Streptomyces sp. DSM 41524]|uniref:NAD-dependent epimerase/dehydratase family protein n=2 Tax=Streptomyces violaceusniger group TaxID=2839105 RepID=A0A6G4AWQ3_9ACTN|nr:MULTISPECIES: NAD-dependent epimerase/dehydratase family protein [Streptomyces]MEE4594713.1 NAD-dependent epimerase/dehydratase family protein [Streptomyces sp. DSM 41524]NEW77678.1 NAD-dependent epimerase/dehydratase family protein [Streptomyces rhizosphaericus]TMU92524.1 NAD-dependent epimerase/dehydratase family protein [Streptomyces sp. DASNCL29]